MKFTKTKLSLALIATSVISAPFAMANDSDLASALTDGKLSANFNLRYESVEQDNAAKDAKAFTLRTRLTIELALSTVSLQLLNLKILRHWLMTIKMLSGTAMNILSWQIQITPSLTKAILLIRRANYQVRLVVR